MMKKMKINEMLNMSGYNEGYLATLKGKKVKFKVVEHFGDIKVQFVDHFANYEI